MPEYLYNAHMGEQKFDPNKHFEAVKGILAAKQDQINQLETNNIQLKRVIDDLDDDKVPLEKLEAEIADIRTRNKAASAQLDDLGVISDNLLKRNLDEN